MISTKKIISIISILVLISSIIFFANRKSENPVEKTSFVEVASTDKTESVSVVPSAITQSNTANQKTVLNAQDAWNVFQKYIQAARTHDISSLEAVAFSLSATCTNPNLRKECFVLMDGVYNIGKSFFQSDYKNFMYDSKQAILYTDSRVESTETKTALVRGYIYFGRDTRGNLKLLALDPSRGLSVDTGTSTLAVLEKKLIEMSIDKDMDTVFDLQELCIDSIGKDVVGCIKTNPLKKDSLGDGWWDGVRIFLR